MLIGDIHFKFQQKSFKSLFLALEIFWKKKK